MSHARRSEPLVPEAIVDRARESGDPLTRRHWCTLLAESQAARIELELIAAFEDEVEEPHAGRRYALRVDVAVEGALTTLDARRHRPS